jgi:membrane-bound lytic murein transglycosylase B
MSEKPSMLTIMRLLSCTVCLLLSAAADAESLPLERQVPAQRADVRAFIDDMVSKHGFVRDRLLDIFKQVQLRQKIIDAISRPAEAKPWYQYRPIFLTRKRIREGVAFWNANQELLARAEAEYGVPAEIIVAILGVETRYGRHQGGYRVLDSLATLAFNYPPRGDFFRGELEQYLLLAREERLDPLGITGSYAGAMGKAQFIASSYRRYAVDFDADGRRDLWDNTADAIGSVANYFKLHQWRPGALVATRVTVQGDQAQSLAAQGYKPHIPVAQLRIQGVMPDDDVNPEQLGALIALETRHGPEYWLGLDNFYVITRYNHSPLYAMAVYQLGRAIREQRHG